MPRWCSILLLSLSPAALTAGLITFGLFVHAISGLFGPRKPAGPIVAAMVGLGILHAGYFLAPWLWAHDRRSLGLWLMLPATLVGLAAIVLFTSNLLAASTAAEGDGMRQLAWLGAIVAAILVYGVPLLVMRA